MVKKNLHKKKLNKVAKRKAQQGNKTGPSQEHSEAVLEKVLSKRAPKTRKGKKIMKMREPQLVEKSKTALVIRGNRASPDVMSLLRDLHRLRYPLSKLYSRKHDHHPFENIEPVEYICKKFDHTLFLFGSSSKKRPFRVIFGRMFNSSLLDMQEYNVTNFQSIASFSLGSKAEATMGNKPLILFQGPGFEADERLKRTKSLLLDYFKGESPEVVSLTGFEHVIVVTAGEPVEPGVIVPATGTAKVMMPQDPDQELPVTVRRYHIQYKKSGEAEPHVELTEIGPRFTLQMDRVKEADRERWKQAIKLPKATKKKDRKSVV